MVKIPALDSSLVKQERVHTAVNLEFKLEFSEISTKYEFSNHLLQAWLSYSVLY